MAGYNDIFRLFRGHYEPWPRERWPWGRLGRESGCRVLWRATGDEPDGAGVAEESVGGGNSPNAQLGNEVRGDEEFFFLESGRVGKKGGGVAVVSDSEKDEIEAGWIA